MLESDGELRAYLLHKGLVNPREKLHLEQLSGGVSSNIWKIMAGGKKWVIKQALAKLKTKANWYSDVGRIHREEQALYLLETMVQGGGVPHIVFTDAAEHLYIMTCAPEDAVPWKQQLMAGQFQEETARNAGRLLRTIHEQSRHLGEEEQNRFRDLTYFEELRIAPFHRCLIEHYPELKTYIKGLIDELIGEQTCLVHGDYSPKNMMVKPDHSIILLDFEAAHWGNPVMDVSFLLAHLLLKGLALGRRAEACSLVQAFLDEYGLETDNLPAHLGLMLLARVDGKSPVEYIADPRTKEQIRGIAVPWIREHNSGRDALDEIIKCYREEIR